jgi:hypothetical protein
MSSPVRCLAVSYRKVVSKACSSSSRAMSSRISHDKLAAVGTYVGAAGGGGGGGAAGAAHVLNDGGEGAASAGPSSATPVRGLLL